MPKQYGVNIHPNLYIDYKAKYGPTSSYISYRMVLCHAIHHDLKNDTLSLSKEIIKNYLDQLLANIENTNVQSDNFFETYRIPNISKVVVIDKTDGTYPLVLHGDEESNLPREYRILSFKDSISDIVDNYDKIFNIINNSDEFDLGLHDELDKFFQEISNKQSGRPKI